MRYLFFFIITFFLTACSEQNPVDTDNTKQDSTKIEDSLSTESTIAPIPQEQTLKGTLISGFSIEMETYLSVVNGVDTIQFFHYAEEHGPIPIGNGKTINALILDNGNEFVLDPEYVGREVEITFEIVDEASASPMVDMDKIRVIRNMLINRGE